MAKMRKLLKALQADGWETTDRRGELLQLRHAKRPGCLTLPSFKATVPDAVARDLADFAGVRLSAAKSKAAD